MICLFHVFLNQIRNKLTWATQMGLPNPKQHKERTWSFSVCVVVVENRGRVEGRARGLDFTNLVARVFWQALDGRDLEQ